MTPIKQSSVDNAVANFPATELARRALCAEAEVERLREAMERAAAQELREALDG